MPCEHKITEKYIKNDIVKCRDCSLVFAKKNSIPTYDRYWVSPREVASNIKKDVFLGRLNIIKKWVCPLNSVLDIGCGLGSFLEVAKKKGVVLVYGIEPSKNGKKACKAKGISLIDYDEDMGFHLEFDAITLWHVLEHMRDPIEYLIKIQIFLGENTLLFMEVPNIESYSAKKEKEKWWYVQDEHLYYFSPKTITAVLEEAGYEVLEIRPIGGFLVSKQSKHILKIDKYYKFLKPLKSVYYWFSHLFKLSDCMLIVARKKAKNDDTPESYRAAYFDAFKKK